MLDNRKEGRTDYRENNEDVEKNKRCNTERKSKECGHQSVGKSE